MQQTRGRLERGDDQIIAGVGSGLAEHFDVDPLWVRLLFVLLALAGGSGFLVYIALWILMPAPGRAGVQSSADLGASLRGMGDDIRRASEGVWTMFGGAPPEPAPGSTAEGGGSPGAGPAGPPSGAGGPSWGPYGRGPHRYSGRHRGITGGLILIVVGIWFLLSNLGLLSWFQWSLTWPVVLIVIGLAILVQRLR
ncbi:MAG: PspC domain-containing protein [Candidatus Dormibacteraceae bacterium]